MTDSNLLELARLGDAQAIAALMNQSLQPRGMNASVARQGDCLEVTLEAERTPNRQALTAFVQQGINNLGISSITSIRIVGQQVGASYPAWMQEVQLGGAENALGNLDDLDNLTATTPLNIQPETETEITAIPLDELPESDASARGVESVDLEAADLSFLPDAEPNMATDELPDVELSSTEPDSPDEMLTALTEPTTPSEELLSPEWDAWSESDIAPDFLQELLADSDRSDHSLFAESPDGSLDTLEGSPEDPADAELDLFFSELEPSGSTTQRETTEELDADLLDFLNQTDADSVDSEAQPQDFSLDALLDPAAELTDADLADLTAADLTNTGFTNTNLTGSTVEPETTSSEQLSEQLPDSLNDGVTSADTPPLTAASPADNLLAGQIEELFDAEIDQPDSGYIEEILPERPTDTAEDLRQALIEDPAARPTPESSDPWSVQVLPELSEARTVLDLPDDEPEPAADLPAFMIEPSPDSPDAALDAAIEPDINNQSLTETSGSSEATDTAAATDLDTLFAESEELAESEEPPISVPLNDPIFYGSIADEEIAEADLEELPPDFLQDFSAEFPDGFPDRFSEVEPSVGEQPAGADANENLQNVPPVDDFLTEPVTLPASSDLSAELAALDLTADAEPIAELTAPEATTTGATFDPDQEAAFDQPILDLTWLTDRPDDRTPIDQSLAASDIGVETGVELDNSENAGATDADLADLLSETPQGTMIGDTTPAEASPSPQPEDFFSEPIAPVEAIPLNSETETIQAETIRADRDAEVGSVVSSPLSEPSEQPEVSQDALEAGLGDFREGFVEPLPEEFFVDEPPPSADWQADLRDPIDLTDETETNYVIEDSTPAVVYTPPPLPESRKAQTPERSNPAWLFPLVLLFVVGWIAGLFGFALFRSRFDPLPSPPPAGESPDAPPASPSVPAAPASPTSQQPTSSAVANLAQSTPLRSAIEQASDAVALTQAAQSADDWGLVASKWQQAIDLLKTVPSTSADYATAQQKLAEYTANVTTARQKANLPIVAAAPLGGANLAQPASPSPNPSPTATAAGVVCNSIPSTPSSQPVALSQVQFDPAVDQAEASPLVGCITNHTEQPIAAVSVAYRNSNAAEATTGNLNFSQLAPKQTVPFKSGFTITPQVQNLTIASISWTAAGTSEAEQLPATISVTRANEEG